MFYIFTIIIPILIIVILYILNKPIKSFNSFFKLYSYSFISILIYAVIVYFLEKNTMLKIGWATYTLILVLVPALLLLFIFLLFKAFKKN